MSIRMAAGKARLTVLGTGWSNTDIESGDGFTEDGDLWKEIADLLDYDPGADVDWDLISESEWPDFEWPDVIYTDPDDPSIKYTDPDGDGIWTDPITGLEYPGGGTAWIPQDDLVKISDILGDIAQADSYLTAYSIPNDVLKSLYGGKVTTEITIVPDYVGSEDRPHSYAPAVWYIQTALNQAYIFLGEPFYHYRANGGEVEVYDIAITIRDGSTKAVYYSGCNTRFRSSFIPSPYNSVPVEYICWQCLYGSLDDALIGKSSSTITSDDIKDGTSGLETMEYQGTTYYKFKDSQVADRL